ncbi:hypothetical protein ACQPYE_01485 [Actinosynnema sp. CA-299493]
MTSRTIDNAGQRARASPDSIRVIVGRDIREALTTSSTLRPDRSRIGRGPEGGPGLRISTTSAERALWYFAIDKTARARLVWVDREEVVREPQSVT